MTKWLLDAYTQGDEVHLVIYDEDQRSLEDHVVNLYFYGYITGGEPEKLARSLLEADGVENAWIETWRAPPYYDSLMKVVVFKTKSMRILKRILSEAVSKGLKVVNTTPHPLVESLYRFNLRPLSMVKRFGNSRVELYEWNPLDRDPVVDYVVVDLENGVFTARTSESVESFTKLEDMALYLSSRRFHLGFVDPYVYVKLVEADPRVSSVAKWVTGGAFNPSEFFEWSRLSYTPLSLMNNLTIGKVLTTIEALLARDRRMISDSYTGRVEKWRRMNELMVYDRGGVVYVPKPGVYWNVCQVDFKSLYPSIMIKYNVSGETINKPNCRNTLRLSWTPHSVCLDEEGVVPASIKKLVELKELYSDLYEKTHDEVYAYRKSAVKWILVASFGYLGYRNSLFGSVMAHEVVTSTSREVMRRARQIAMKKGYRVVHAIVDSIFVEGVKTLDECFCLKNEIENATGFKAKVEAHYVWLYIPRSLNGSEAVANKYYGLLFSGSLKIKGVMAVRRDVPLLIKRAQLDAISKLAEATTPASFEEKVVESHRVIDRYIEYLKSGDVEIHELIVTRHSRTRGEYKKPPSYMHEAFPPYRLVYSSSGLIPFEKANMSRVDLDKYVQLLEKARKELPSCLHPHTGSKE
ncbi:MAG: DNA polymerase domain-containing protein [Desulfurococcaceae archaeon]